MNIKFIYLYRDAGNYKQWGVVVFRNPEAVPSAEVEQRLRKAFFQNELFIAGQIGVPERFLYASGEATEDDICFHEFDSVETTEEVPNDSANRSIAGFLRDVERASMIRWSVFVPV